MNRSSGITKNAKQYLSLDDDAKLPISFYDKVPNLEISLAEFESFAFDRFCLLQEVEKAKLQTSDPEDRKLLINTISRKYMPLDSSSLANTSPAEMQRQRRKDMLSHFILRLAFCQSSERTAWFIQNEAELFKVRFGRLSSSEKQSFINTLSLPFTVAQESELPSFNFGDPSNKAALKTNFEQVLDLVAKRQVVLEEGVAYVPLKYRVDMLVGAFKDHLQKSVKVLVQVLPQMTLEDDDRLVPILQYFANARTSDAYVPNSNGGAQIEGGVTASMVDSLVKHFPLCMKELQRSLSKTKHLSHIGRIQYGLFLKGIGMPIEESLKYWRMAFSKLSDDEFNKKNYAYYIRYNYGLEGRRTSYAPFSCYKIITSNHPGPNDNHGCPYRHYSPQILRNRLQMENLDEFQINQIFKLVETKHYESACSKVFELTKGRLAHWNADDEFADMDTSDEGNKLAATIVHPNQYFEFSYRLDHPATDGDEGKPQIFVKKSAPVTVSTVNIPLK